MAGTTEIFVFKDALIVLGTAAVVAPVVHRLKISPILGFLVVGAALGPHGLGRLAEYSRAIDWFTVTGERQIAFIADLGIVFLLFFIGLELSMRRLLTMRRLVFGLGGLQVLVTALAIGLGALWLGQPPAAALIIGTCLALSSTAIVMELLSRPAPHDVDDRPHQLRHPARPGPCRGAAAVPDQRAGRTRRGRLGGPGRRRGAGRGGDRRRRHRRRRPRSC